jgi:GT2 family glycosyltransferase
VLANGENVGFGAACNRGARATDAPLLLFLNPDARLNVDALAALHEALRADSHCAAAGCRLIDAEGRETVTARNFLTPFNEPFEHLGLARALPGRALRRTHRVRLDADLVDRGADWLSGACLLARRAAFEEVGGFDESFFLYGEDEDLCRRWRAAGWSLAYTAAGTAVHRGAASSRQDRARSLALFYAGQARLLERSHGAAGVLAYRVLMRAVCSLKRGLVWVIRAADRDSRRRDLAARRAALRLSP